MLASQISRLTRWKCSRNVNTNINIRSLSTCLNIIVSHYQNRLQAYQLQNSTLILSRTNTSNDDLKKTTHHHIVLTARPDEFEKLPPKCSACGIFLQSEYEDSLGYIPKKKVQDSIENNSSEKLICYPCYQLRYHNKKVSISRPTNQEIFNQVSHLRRIKALVLYVIDVFDIEGSLLNNIVQLIGGKKRVIIVVNKVDRLPRDDSRPAKQLERMKDIVKQTCIDNGLSENNFRDICFVSARTGYGMQTLVQKINKFREVNMDVYLIGCANTGKSTLYNLIVNLLDVHKPEFLPTQAIEHYSPGSTMSLLRQPISMRRLLRLDKRLQSGPWQEELGFEFDEEFLQFMDVREQDQHMYRNAPLLTDSNKSIKVRKPELVENNGDKQKKEKQNYIYDTPGIIQPQVTEYLELDEMKYLNPSLWVVPRTLIMKPGDCMFIGGLARFDFNKIWRPEIDDVTTEDDLSKSSQSIYVTVMASPNLPLHASVIDGADEKYRTLFLNNILKIPKCTAERLQEFPQLQPVDYTVIGKNLNINCSDLVVHGVGWLSIAAVTAARVEVSLHTPNGIGQCLRREPLLPYSVRRKSGRGVSYLGRTSNKMYGHTRKNSPSFVRVFQQQNDTVHAWKNKIIEKLKVQNFQQREDKRLKRLEQGVVLGKWRQIRAKEQQIENLLESDNKALK